MRRSTPLDPASGVSVPMVLVGVLAFLAVDVLMLVALDGRPPLSFAVVLGVAVAVGSAVLLITRNRDARGLGIGVLVGWALATQFSGGLLTGLA
ncbi:hypothetical protein ACFQV2_32800 [Actinokineospora soli]|uniref:Sensor histidine kinase n=1 Tax=Actinokineospora soli TaxID=1048753 RepID=A0ABW2TYH3_9PSEU